MVLLALSAAALLLVGGTGRHAGNIGWQELRPDGGGFRPDPIAWARYDHGSHALARAGLELRTGPGDLVATYRVTLPFSHPVVDVLLKGDGYEVTPRPSLPPSLGRCW